MRMSLHRITITSRRFFPVSTLVFFLFLSAQSPQKILAFSVAGTGTDSASVDTTLYEVSAARLKSMIRDDKRIVELSGGVKVKHLTASITSDRGLNYPDERVTYLYDNVRVLDGTMRTRSDTGEYYGDRDVIVMKGHVSLVDRGVILHCDLGEYDRARRLATFTGNLRLSDSTRVLYADTIRYDRNTDAAEAFGHVVLIDEVENYSIAGKHGIYYTTEKRAFIDKSPILTFDLKSKEKGTVKSRWMKFDTAERIGYAIRNVRMVKGETRAECDSAVIYSNEGIVDLFGSPYATNGQSSMKGKRMRFLYDDKEVKEIILPDKGKLSQKPSKGSPWREDSWIKGDSIEIFLSNEKVDSVMIVGSCEAMYYPIETDRSKSAARIRNSEMYPRVRREILGSTGRKPKLEMTKKILREHLDSTTDGRVMIFAEYRDTIDFLISEIGTMEGVKAKRFIGQAKGTGSGMSQEEQKKTLDEFGEGKFNVLISTSIGEEGIDIPSTTLVLFYEPVPSAIRYIQRRGRTARDGMPGNVMILIMRGSRDEAYYWSSINKEKKMYSQIYKLKKELEAGMPRATERKIMIVDTDRKGQTKLDSFAG